MLLEPDVIEPYQLLIGGDTVNINDHHHHGDSGVGDDYNRAVLALSSSESFDDNYSMPLLSPKKGARGYFQASDIAENHQSYDSGSGSCEPLHNG